MKAARLDAVVCTYNNAPSLERTLRSIAAQELHAAQALSILVVDNNSTDDTPEVVRQVLETAGCRYRYVREERQGLAFARQRAFLESQADWLAFIDDDCELNARWLLRAGTHALSYPRAGAFGGRVRAVLPADAPSFAERRRPAFAEQDCGPAPLLLDEPIPRLVGAGLVVRKRAVEESRWLETFALAGRSGTGLGAGEDTELLLAVRRAGYETWYFPDLRLDHHIAAPRVTLDYLCRLHYGLGASRPALQLLAGQASVESLPRRAFFLARHAAGLAWFTARWALAALARSDREPDRRIDWHQMRGRARGALRLAGAARDENPPRAAATKG